MLTVCRLSEDAKKSLQAMFGCAAAGAEAEFKELPYFLVTRSRTAWDAGEKGDINTILLVAVNERGLVVDPERGANEPARLTLIPWPNVVSFSITRPAGGAV